MAVPPLTIAVTCETLIRFLCEDKQQHWSITLADLTIREREAS